MTSQLLCTDALAIRCIGDFVLVGMGCLLHVFRKDTYQLQMRLQCLYPSNIHGIVPGPGDRVAVFGAKAMCVCDIKVEGDRVVFKEVSKTWQFNDWIIAVEWVTVKNSPHLAILFAHNNVCVYDVDNNKHHTVWCKEKCILYGGSMVKECNQSLIVFSGTVFQEILIWKVNYGFSSCTNAPVLHHLTGHNGVIFSVVYDPCLRIICSASDDRTVRLWEITDSCTNESDVNWEKAEVKLLRTMFGHSSRVWRAVIRDQTVISIGEDSLMCTWSIGGKLLTKVYAHHGAAIWSIAVSEDNKNIFTGGADGAVYVWPLTHNNIPQIISINQCSNSAIHKVPKYICYLKNGTALVFAEGGFLLCYSKGESYHRESMYLEKYSTYCIMQISPCRSYVALASREGDVSIYQGSDTTNHTQLQLILEEKIMKSQIFSMQWLCCNKLLLCGSNGLLNVVEFQPNNGSISIVSEFLLPLSRERWVTAAILYKSLLICGDRAGNIHVFKYESEVDKKLNIPKEQKEPIQTLVKVHSKIGVQSFTTLDTKLLSTGRDGVIRFYALCNDNDGKLLNVLYGKKMPMDWISGTLKVNDEMLVLGFKEVEFIIYNIFSQRIIARIPCGGGHRSWDCMVLDTVISFAYIRNKQVYIFNYPLYSIKLPVILHGFHTKEAYCIQPLLNFKNYNIFVSGGEDCALRICYISYTTSKNNNYTFHTLDSFDGHISSIRSIATLHKESTESCSKHLVFSGGGRAQLKIWEISVNTSTSELHNTDVLCSDIKSHMLYGQTQTHGKSWQWKIIARNKSYIPDPETRYMDINIYVSPDSNQILLFIACADGYLRIFEYKHDSNDIYLRSSIKCADRCILKTHVLQCKNRVVVLTMATDGIVRFLDFTDVVSEVLNSEHEGFNTIDNAVFERLKLHQSGINSFDIRMIKDDEYLLATGGDDNRFSLIAFQICVTDNENPLSILKLSEWNIATAHSAQITGIKFRNETQIYSVGMDQQIIMYNYTYRNSVVSVSVANKVYTSVPDVQGMTLQQTELDEVLICVYGKGFEVISV